MKHFALMMMPLLFSYCSCDDLPASRQSPDPQSRDSVAHEMRRVLDEEFSRWYPLCLDTVYGGYFSDIDSTWQLSGRQDKFIVTQARHIWSSANYSLFNPADTALRDVASHGLAFIRDHMWDQVNGGFYDLVDRRGEPRRERGVLIKRAYGNAFALYALAAYVHAFGDSAVLHLAQETFRWLDKHSYDPVHGGYFQFMEQDGTPLVNGYSGAPPKDQNSSIHLLEALTELYRVWPDPLLHERLSSLLRIVRDTITTDKGYMVLFFQRDWSPISYRDSSAVERERHYELDHVSFGHDVETAYLMLEASETLGLPDDVNTLRVAKRMVDHTLHNGWDATRGGIYDGGYYFRGDTSATIIRKTKEWWAQAEAFNAFLMMADLFPDDLLRYEEKFLAQWKYCKSYVIDKEHGGWFWGGVDSVPANASSPKGSIWKGNYHTSRALINCIRRMEKHRP